MRVGKRHMRGETVSKDGRSRLGGSAYWRSAPHGCECTKFTRRQKHEKRPQFTAAVARSSQQMRRVYEHFSCLSRTARGTPRGDLRPRGAQRTSNRAPLQARDLQRPAAVRSPRSAARLCRGLRARSCAASQPSTPGGGENDCPTHQCGGENDWRAAEARPALLRGGVSEEVLKAERDRIEIERGKAQRWFDAADREDEDVTAALRRRSSSWTRTAPGAPKQRPHLQNDPGPVFGAGVRTSSNWRRGRDSNPRWSLTPILA